MTMRPSWVMKWVVYSNLLSCTLLNYTVLYCTTPYQTVLSMYLDNRRKVQGNTSMRLRELPRLNVGIFLCSPTQVKVQT